MSRPVNLEARIVKLYANEGLAPPWLRVRHRRNTSFLGVMIDTNRKRNDEIEARIRTLRSELSGSAESPDKKAQIIVQELVRLGMVESSESYKALPVAKEWMTMLHEGKVDQWEKWMRAEVPGFISSKEPTIERITFCFLLDNHVIPHERFRFKPELNKMLRYYRKYQPDPKKGLLEPEKGELSELIEFFCFLQLDNKNVIRILLEALQMGLEIDFERGKLKLDDRQKYLMRTDDIRWRIAKAIRWIPNNDPKTIAIMKAFTDSPNGGERLYAIGYLGKAAGRLYPSDSRQMEEIIRFLLEREIEILRNWPPFMFLEIIKALLGNWDARQPFMRRYLFDYDVSIQALNRIAENIQVDPAVRREAIRGMKIFAEFDPGGKAEKTLIALTRSAHPFARREARLALNGELSKPANRIFMAFEQLPVDVEQQLSFRGRLDPYSRMEEWDFVGFSLGRGTLPFEVAIRDKKWLAIMKRAPSSSKLPFRIKIPAVERITSSLGWVLGMRSLSRVQLIENEERQDSYFAYAVGQRAPLEPEIYDLIFEVKRAQEQLSRSRQKQGYHLERAIRHFLEGIYDERDMDSEEMETNPHFGEVLVANRVGSTLGFLGREKEADAWFEKAAGVFSNPEFLDQSQLFDAIVGNEDQYGYRNMLVAERRKSERGRIFLIDFAACFGFLQRGDLDWTDHLKKFYLYMQMIAEDAPRIFINNIKPLIGSFLELSPPAIEGIVEEIDKGELTSKEKMSLRLLLMAEKEVLAREFIKRRKI